MSWYFGYWLHHVYLRIVTDKIAFIYVNIIGVVSVYTKYTVYINLQISCFSS